MKMKQSKLDHDQAEANQLSGKNFQEQKLRQVAKAGDVIARATATMLTPIGPNCTAVMLTPFHLRPVCEPGSDQFVIVVVAVAS